MLAESARVARVNISEQLAASSASGGVGWMSSTAVPSIPIDLPGTWKWNRDRAPLYRTGRGDTDAIDPDDVVQGALGSCFLLANLKALALVDPDLIRRLIRDNGDGTYTVTFDDDGVPSTVTVNNEFPTLVHPMWFDDRVPFAKRGDGELWVRLLEKAYVEKYHGGYGPIPDGYLSEAIEHLTGREPTSVYPGWMTDDDLDVIGARLAAREIAVTSGTPPDAQAAGLTDMYREKVIAERHAYSVERIDTERNLVHLDNPHRRNDLVLTYDEYRTAFNQLHVVDVTNGGGGGG